MNTCFSLLRKRPRPCENSIGPQHVITVLSYVCIIRGSIQEIVVKFSREFGKRRAVLQLCRSGLICWANAPCVIRFPVCSSGGNSSPESPRL